MARFRSEWRGSRLIEIFAISFLMASLFVSTKGSLEQEASSYSEKEEVESDYYVMKVLNFFWQPGRLGYTHVWPEMEFGWKIVVGTIIGFFGSAFGTVGGVGGGGIFVPMLTLIIGFDQKSSTAISKCMIMGGAGATVFYNLKQRHPTLDLPVIDYDLALLFQPMLVLGISIGVAFNVIFADWMITVLLIITFLVTSIKAYLKGIETWKKETIVKMEAARASQSTGSGMEEVEYKPLPEGPGTGTQSETKESEKSKVSIVDNVYWKEVGILFAVWIFILGLEIAKIPVTFGVSGYEAVNLYKGRRVIASKGDADATYKLHQLVLYCIGGIVAGIVGGLLGLGGGFILGPLFLELGIPPQVSSATATFAMTFSSSMSVVEYYLLKRFPVPYALYFVAISTIAAIIGQYVVRKVIAILGRASLIIFILATTIFVSAISLGGVGIANVIKDIQEKAYMGFEDICTYDA
ncbi:sulfite exporter TauE/SafE family protein 3-like isoform X2 [Juglans microcarpa x Juglans regia]|uniref:sulfite exporter TauE/SafE family protein 3-like isoform X2 n=1 Tax=Juglans microcarpa x Juglans regia TaxID=2249226 RepID=UPI001B7E6A14|nr:sulfite exporter TauE/SafE family protein 3-like isoform X2 [Juglans microcarpa x Juglans regia]